MSVRSDDSRAAIDAFERDYRRLKARQVRRMLAASAVFLAIFLISAEVGEFEPLALIEGVPSLFNYIGRTLPTLSLATLFSDLADWFWALPTWLGLLLDTVLIAFMGTLLGTIGALALCFSGSTNLMSNRTIYFVSRRVLEVTRTVPDLVFALIFVRAFGLGELPGVLAIALSSMGALGKLYSEVNENIDMRPVDGMRAAGADWFQTIRYGVVPQVLPNYASYTLLRFEINVRSAAVIGFVGAGGIGQELYFVIRQFIYTDISAIVIMIVLTVMAIDLSCERLRHRFIGREGLS